MEIREIDPNEFDRAMDLLAKELGKNRVRSRKFLEIKFREFPEYFIGVYLENELIGFDCGFPREDYLLISEIAIDSRFKK